MTGRGIIEAKFIPGKTGRLFALHRPPRVIGEESECFVIAHPFAEEMNRCRYMCTMFGQSITEIGHGYLSVDYYGTGDSQGEFVDGDWTIWCGDLETACHHAAGLGYTKISLLAIRLGALLAMEIANTIDNLHRIILWQPVISGKSALTQFLRIRIAASLGRDEKADNTSDFENQITAGNPIQVAGYEVSPGLYRGVKTASLNTFTDFNRVPIAWFNTMASEERKAPRVETDTVEKWRGNGADLYYSTVIGPSYWAVHERTLAPALVLATVDYVTGPKLGE